MIRSHPQLPRLRDEPLLLALLLALTVLGVAPIWATDLLPLVDIAAHLHLMTVMHDLPGSPLLQHHYREVHALVPYLSYYKLVDWLAQAMSVEQANRVVLTLTVAAMPWSALAYLRAAGHSPWLLLGVFPWMLHCDFFMGFFNYLLSIPIFLLILAAHLRWLQRPSPRRGLVLGGLLGLLALTHYLLWAVALVLLPALALVFAARQRWQRALWWPLRDGLVCLPSLLLLLPWFVRYFVLAEGVKTADAAIHRSGGTLLQRLGNVYQGEHIGPLANLRQIPDVLFDAVYRTDARLALTDRPGEVVAVLWLAALVLWLIGTARVPRPATPATPQVPVGVTGSPHAAWAVAILVAEYFLMPRNLSKPIALYGVNFRLVEVAMVLLICALPLDPLRPPGSVRRRVHLGAALMVICALLLPLATIAEFRADRALLGDIRAAYGAIPPGKRVLTLRGRRPSRWFLFNLGEYYAVFRHGYVPYSFADTSSKPVVLDPLTALPAPPAVDLEFFSWRQHGRYYDYIVRYDEPDVKKPWQPNLPRLPLVLRAPGWTVWHNPQPEPWPPPSDAEFAERAFAALAPAVRDQMASATLALGGLPGPQLGDAEDVLVAGFAALPGPWPRPLLPWSAAPARRWPPAAPRPMARQVR